MKRIFLLLCVFLFANFCRSQLLSWAPEFPKDNDNVTITVDATKGNQGLLNFAGNVYVHVGVITNLSTGPANWKYSKFTWGSTEAAALATSAGTNKWAYTINNIRAFFGVPAGETILRIAILFRAGNCTDCLAQRNADLSDMYLPVYDNNLAVRFNVPLMQPLYTPIPEPINKVVGENINITAVASGQFQYEIVIKWK
jgi:hypothetical protein